MKRLNHIRRSYRDVVHGDAAIGVWESHTYCRLTKARSIINRFFMLLALPLALLLLDPRAARAQLEVTLLDSGTTSSLNDIFFVNADTGFIVGADGFMLKTSDGGATWTALESGTTDALRSVHFFNEQTGLVTSGRSDPFISENAPGNIYRTTDGGMTWALVHTEFSGMNDVDFIDENTAVAVGAAGVSLKSTDGGVTWGGRFNSASQRLLRVSINDAGRGLAVGCCPMVLHTTDGGESWQRPDIGTDKGWMLDVFPGRDSTWIIVGTVVLIDENPAEGTILRSTDEGETWMRGSSKEAHDLYAVSFVNDDRGIAVGSFCTIRFTTNGGMAWAPQECGIENGELRAVAFADENTAFAVGWNGLLLRIRFGQSVAVEGEELPEAFTLHQNYPNPFNPSTEIGFDVPEASEVRLVVYDVTGREVARLVDRSLPAGHHRVTWQAEGVPSGVYVYRITAGAFVEARRLVLLR